MGLQATAKPAPTESYPLCLLAEQALKSSVLLQVAWGRHRPFGSGSAQKVDVWHLSMMCLQLLPHGRWWWWGYHTHALSFTVKTYLEEEAGRAPAVRVQDSRYSPLFMKHQLVEHLHPG